MLTTRDVIRALRIANPGKNITEDTIRYAIRQDKVQAPRFFSGAYAWEDDDVKALAVALGLRPVIAGRSESRG